MSSIAQVSDALRGVLTIRAKELERETGFVQRSTAQLDGPTFVHTTVFGWLDTPEASYPQLRHVAASLGVPVSSQAVEQRCSSMSAGSAGIWCRSWERRGPMRWMCRSVWASTNGCPCA